MKNAKIYINTRKDPLWEVKDCKEEMLKHQISSMLLLHLDEIPDVKKIRIIIEDEED